VSSCALMVFNELLFARGLRGIPMDLAQAGAVIGVGRRAAFLRAIGSRGR